MRCANSNPCKQQTTPVNVRVGCGILAILQLAHIDTLQAALFFNVVGHTLSDLQRQCSSDVSLC